jgi:hypothetical protein
MGVGVAQVGEVHAVTCLHCVPERLTLLVSLVLGSDHLLLV